MLRTMRPFIKAPIKFMFLNEPRFALHPSREPRNTGRGRSCLRKQQPVSTVFEKDIDSRAFTHGIDDPTSSLRRELLQATRARLSHCGTRLGCSLVLPTDRLLPQYRPKLVLVIQPCEIEHRKLDGK